jgi:hypothetical protein
MIALVVSPWAKSTAGKRKTSDPARTIIERTVRGIVITTAIFGWNLNDINVSEYNRLN